jgi:hypothetical protein
VGVEQGETLKAVNTEFLLCAIQLRPFPTSRALLEYKSGQRRNDIYSRMRLIAQQLSDEEIRELAQYYQQLN